MSTLNIVEFRQIQTFFTEGTAQIAMCPPVTTQSITITGTNATSAAFNANTNIVRLQSDANCSIAWSLTTSTIATATATSFLLIAGAPEYFGVLPGLSLAAITTA